MNKKLLITLLVGVMALALVNAVLVTYLSNRITAVQTIDSPMVLGISSTEDNWQGTLELDDMYTGGSNVVTFYTREQNIAPESVTGDIVNVITSSGITCADFDSIMVSTKTDEGNYGQPVDMLNVCEQDGYNKVKFTYPNQPLIWDAGQVDINMITVTFNDVVGTYTFTSQIIPTA